MAGRNPFSAVGAIKKIRKHKADTYYATKNSPKKPKRTAVKAPKQGNSGGKAMAKAYKESRQLSRSQVEEIRRALRSGKKAVKASKYKRK